MEKRRLLPVFEKKRRKRLLKRVDTLATQLVDKAKELLPGRGISVRHYVYQDHEIAGWEQEVVNIIVPGVERFDEDQFDKLDREIFDEFWRLTEGDEELRAFVNVNVVSPELDADEAEWLSTP